MKFRSDLVITARALHHRSSVDCFVSVPLTLVLSAAANDIFIAGVWKFPEDRIFGFIHARLRRRWQQYTHTQLDHMVL